MLWLYVQLCGSYELMLEMHSRVNVKGLEVHIFFLGQAQACVSQVWILL
jgi:hypothetical protein